jgi:DNA (cytosine-5)-methyltransferase 1
VEIEAFAAANLVAKIEAGRLDAAPVWTDIKSFPVYRFRDRVHIVTAGYPCQPFSVAGKRKGSSDPRHLWPDIERIVKAVRPVWCFFENVPGHLTLGFPTVYRSLQNMGYKVEAGLFTAAECGLSMEDGKRLFILAQAESFGGKLLLQPRQQKQTNFDAGRSSKILGKAVCERLQRLRPTESARRNEFATTSFTVAPQGIYQKPWEKKRYIESRLGRAVNGTTCRVDRLRLLGNGVVPQQAELAFRTLKKLFE